MHFSRSVLSILTVGDILPIRTKQFVLGEKVDTGKSCFKIESMIKKAFNEFNCSAVCWNADALTDVQLGGAATVEAEVNVS